MLFPTAVARRKNRKSELEIKLMFMKFHKYVQDLLHYQFYQGDIEEEECDLFLAA